MFRTWLVLIALVVTGFVGRVAQGADPVSPPPEAAATAPAAGSAPSSVPPPANAPAPGVDESAATAGVPMVEAAAQAATPAQFGVGARLRLTSVPKWLLGLFLTESVPITSYTAGLEFFRRSGNFDFVLGVAYQSLSPNPGNWLGKGNDASTETDYVQFDGLGAYSVDAAFILHTEFTEYMGMHYGGGVGIGITTGRMLRTSDGTAGCAKSPGDTTKCYPVRCPQGPCTEAQLKNTEGGTDSYLSPSRFSDSRVPSVYPIVNVITGLDIKVPSVPRLAIRIDIGYFFPYFFIGPSIGYQI
jgi:hypothetical protein